MPRMKNLLLLTASLVLVLLGLEAATRLFFLPLPVVADPVLGYRRAPGMTLAYAQENDHPVRSTFNSRGFRGPDFAPQPQPGLLRVAVLGDSFVASEAVEEDRTFPRLAEARWNAAHSRPVEVLNCGVSGYSPVQEFLLLKDEVLAAKPDAVYLFFFPTNDIEDMAATTAMSRNKPFAALGPEGTVAFDFSFARGSRYQAKAAVTALRRQSALANLLYERLSPALTRGYQRRFHPEGGLPPYLTLATDRPDPAFLANYATAKALFRQAAALCRDRGIPFTLVLVDYDGVSPEAAAKLTALAPSFDPLWFEKDLQRAAARDGYGFLGLQSLFRDLYAAGGADYHWQHWNYAGQEAVARALAARMAVDLSPAPEGLAQGPAAGPGAGTETLLQPAKPGVQGVSP
ncbi:lipolytic protein G-D-S-L family [Solidesulfovibrio carbinoliphilus subsp. oakridgensis]|uniref:Lipolytic protein G-D-S-L family n=2 Tax=Solidesulfovibrio carbinoliphilus TaxID=345370 RepID=G7Q6H8_9BACT|nr:lipolytic protein G-D-S-L family [Solidesulfovibrio carbinoliphilus subsp. oakridgensis]